jgi:hypothetical protein
VDEVVDEEWNKEELTTAADLEVALYVVSTAVFVEGDIEESICWCSYKLYHDNDRAA